MIVNIITKGVNINYGYKNVTSVISVSWPTISNYQQHNSDHTDMLLCLGLQQGIPIFNFRNQKMIFMECEFGSKTDNILLYASCVKCILPS